MKKMKFSLGMKIVSLLSCVALVSMGFASWWIVKLPETDPYTNGSFTAYAVAEKNITIDNFVFTEGNNDAKIVFGKDNSTQKWLLAGTDVEAENMDATFTFDITVKDGESASTTPINTLLSKVTMVLTPSNTTALNSAIKDTENADANYIKAPTVTISYGSGDKAYTVTGTYDSATGTITADILMTNATASTLTVTVLFDIDWGTAFGGANPYAYFNGLTYSSAYATQAQKALSALYDLNATTYTVTFTPAVVGAA